MNTISLYALKALRRLYTQLFGTTILAIPECNQDPDSVSQKISDALSSNQPIMIARFGSTELNIIVNYLGVKNCHRNVKACIMGKDPAWWWQKKLIFAMYNNAGFFPPNTDKIEQFCELMLQYIPQVDILGSWMPNERYFEKEMQNCQMVNLELLNPYFSTIPWTNVLEGKKVLVVHPFAHTIESQYQKRGLLFKNNLLPAFELKTIKAVQSISGEKTKFADWFEALDYMKDEINKVDFDICLIGCGAFGFPLAAHVKRMGKKGFHLGGSLQLLFGIRGKRWEDENYNNVYNYARLMNEYWVKPSDQETPQNAVKVENACYW